MASELELAYIGGLFDGEGTLTIGKLKPKPHVYGGLKNPSYMLRFQIVQQDRWILDWCQSVVGLGHVTGSNVVNKINDTLYCGKMGYWQAGGKTAYAIISVLRPWVRVKKAQVELGIMFYETSGWRRWRETPHGETLKRAAFYHVIRALNKGAGHVDKAGELLGYPNSVAEDNQQPSHSNIANIVEWKVQRLMDEDAITNKSNTSARPEREDIVRACEKS